MRRACKPSGLHLGFVLGLLTGKALCGAGLDLGLRLAEVEQLKVVLRLCQDVKAFANLNAFEHAITRVVAIARQNEGWLKSQGHGQSRQAMPSGLATPGAL